MKAIVMQRHGDSSVLQYVDYPEPSIGANDVLVRACALNHSRFVGEAGASRRDDSHAAYPR